MKITNTTKEQIEKALQEVNKRFDGNIEFYRLDPANQKGTAFNVRLKVKDSRGKGARFGFQRNKDGNPRRTSATCWHAHGYFHDALNQDAVIHSAGQKKYPGDQWEDWNAGSHFNPRYMSEMCECDE